MAAQRYRNQRAPIIPVSRCTGVARRSISPRPRRGRRAQAPGPAPPVAPRPGSARAAASQHA
eukprot:13657296-Alexandrium_andersonii.AAC.1